MEEVAIEDMDEWRPFCGTLYPIRQVAGEMMMCTISPHDPVTTRHVNMETGFSWWGV